MAVFLDKIEVENEDKEYEATMKAIFATLFDFAKKNNRAIFKFAIDGKEYYIDVIQDFFDLKEKEVKKLEFFTLTKEELFVKMSALGSSLTLMTKKLESFSLLLNEGKDLETLEVLREISIIMHRLFLCHSLFIVFNIPMEYDLNGKSLTVYRDEINAMLRTILDAFKAKDIVEMADIAEYELAPLIENLGQSLTRILES